MTKATGFFFLNKKTELLKTKKSSGNRLTALCVLKELPVWKLGRTRPGVNSPETAEDVA